MHRTLLGLTLAAFALAGCTKAEEAAAEAVGRVGAKGRFVGVGTYSPGRLWNQLSRPALASPADPAAATLKDDDHVIVVIDTATGELRQCGNLSGHCLTSNPWAKTTSSQPAPAAVLKHLDQLLAEDKAEMEAELKSASEIDRKRR